jgi:CO/xanthine dehydrogenase Mo-binding subunit
MTKKRGIGISAVWYSTGLSGGGDPSMCTIKVQQDGSVDVLIGSIDIGQGVRTIVRQIAAEELGVSLDKVNVSLVDTDTSPWDTGTFASRLTHHTGNATIQAAREARAILFDSAAEMLDADPARLTAKDDLIMVDGDPKKSKTIAEVSGYAQWVSQKNVVGRGAYGWPAAVLDPVTGKGEQLHSMAYGSTVAEVEVDDETGEVKVLKLVSAYECGKAINPLLVEGQIDGGSAGGLGSALMEELHPYYPTLDHYPTGFFSYMFPTAKDVPQLDSVIIEVPNRTGPYGAKGVGEMTANTQAPAIISAIHNAVGVWLHDMPATPQKVLKAIEEKELADKKGKAK